MSNALLSVVEELERYHLVQGVPRLHDPLFALPHHATAPKQKRATSQVDWRPLYRVPEFKLTWQLGPVLLLVRPRVRLRVPVPRQAPVRLQAQAQLPPLLPVPAQAPCTRSCSATSSIGQRVDR